MAGCARKSISKTDLMTKMCGLSFRTLCVHVVYICVCRNPNVPIELGRADPWQPYDVVSQHYLSIGLLGYYQMFSDYSIRNGNT